MVRKIKKCSLACLHRKMKKSEKDEEIFNWLLKEYDSRGKELLELEKLSFLLFPISISIVTFVFPRTTFSAKEMAFYALPAVLFLSVLFSTAISSRCNKLRKKLVGIELRLKELKPHSVFDYYEKTNIPSKFYRFITNGKSLLALLLVNILFALFCFEELLPFVKNIATFSIENIAPILGLTSFILLSVSAIDWGSKRI